MATKRYNQQNFYIDVNGKTLSFYCWTTHTRNGFCHTVWCFEYDQTTKVGYYNRTWESFEYETALRNAFGKLSKLEKAICDLWADKKTQSEHEACEAFLKKFETLHKSLTDTQKASLANVEITNQEQADATLKVMQIMSVLNQ